MPSPETLLEAIGESRLEALESLSRLKLSSVFQALSLNLVLIQAMIKAQASGTPKKSSIRRDSSRETIWITNSLHHTWVNMRASVQGFVGSELEKQSFFALMRCFGQVLRQVLQNGADFACRARFVVALVEMITFSLETHACHDPIFEETLCSALVELVVLTKAMHRLRTIVTQMLRPSLAAFVQDAVSEMEADSKLLVRQSSHT